MVVSKASLGREPIRPRIVVRTASWTFGWAVDMKRPIRSEGERLATTRTKGFDTEVEREVMEL